MEIRNKSINVPARLKPTKSNGNGVYDPTLMAKPLMQGQLYQLCDINNDQIKDVLNE
jgi:hypothetical protein